VQWGNGSAQIEARSEAASARRANQSMRDRRARAVSAVRPRPLKQHLEAFLSDDYDLIKRIALDTDLVARGPRFANELQRGELAEVTLEADFQYECWMMTTVASWRSPITKAIAGFAKDG